jgi:hypothetical protein
MTKTAKKTKSPGRVLDTSNLARVRGGAEEPAPARQQLLATMVLMG